VIRAVWLCLLLSLGGGSAGAEEPLRVAVASNFAVAMEALLRAYRQQGGPPLQTVTASTGKLYAQIVQGAPFDLFLAADAERPERLEREGKAIAGSRFTYAIGRLVLWSPDPLRVDDRGEVLRRGTFRYLAMANPRLAPYGRAAKEVLQGMGLWSGLKGRIVRGENVGQAYHFVQSGNADIGFVAWSQLAGAGRAPEGSWWLPPADGHAPIEQQAVRLSPRPAAGDFLAFLKSEAARRIIERHGYRLP